MKRDIGKISGEILKNGWGLSFSHGFSVKNKVCTKTNSCGGFLLQNHKRDIHSLTQETKKQNKPLRMKADGTFHGSKDIMMVVRLKSRFSRVRLFFASKVYHDEQFVSDELNVCFECLLDEQCVWL